MLEIITTLGHDGKLEFSLRDSLEDVGCLYRKRKDAQ